MSYSGIIISFDTESTIDTKVGVVKVVPVWKWLLSHYGCL